MHSRLVASVRSAPRPKRARTAQYPGAPSRKIRVPAIGARKRGSRSLRGRTHRPARARAVVRRPSSRAVLEASSSESRANRGVGAPSSSRNRSGPSLHSAAASSTNAAASLQSHSDLPGYSSETGAPNSSTPSGSGTRQSRVCSPSELRSWSSVSMQPVAGSDTASSAANTRRRMPGGACYGGRAVCESAR